MALTSEEIAQIIAELNRSSVELTTLDNAPSVEGRLPLIQGDNLYGLDLRDMISISSSEISSWFNE